jgi:hypothetical protein
MDYGNESILGSLARTESGGSFQASNEEVGAGGMRGHFGRLQFSRARLQDAERAGVLPSGTTPEMFMADPALQQQVETWHLNDMRQKAEQMGLDQYIGQNVGGVPITMDSILAMGHLGGIDGASRYLQSGGQYNPSDVYGTSLRDYALTHGGATPQARISTRNVPANTQNTGVAMDDTMQQQPSSGELSRDQRMVLGFAALRDAGAALQGQNTNFFVDTMSGFQQQAQAEEDRRFRQAQFDESVRQFEAQQAAGGGLTAQTRTLMQTAELAGLTPGTPEFVEFVNQQLMPQSFRSIALQALEAGLTPGTPEYQSFIETRGAGARAQAVVEGTATGEENVQVRALERGLPVLQDFVEELREVGDVAEYRFLDEVAANIARQAGDPLSEGAIARQKFTAMVDNQILPLLKATFGAAFTAEEGARLRATLGDETLSPAEKNAQLDAFIKAKEREIRAMGGQVPDASATPGTPGTPDTSAMSDEDLLDLYSGGGQ